MILSNSPIQGAQLELSYALVGGTGLNWLPQVDELITLYCGERLRSVAHEQATWTNMGPRHSLRLASQDGIEDLLAAQALFSQELKTLFELTGQLDGTLLPTGMHPWAKAQEAELWPHSVPLADNAQRGIFGIARHGLCNQNPLRLSLPFANEIEFERLFGALRFIMPLMASLSASSPFAEGKRGPALSCRLASRRDLYANHVELPGSLIPKPATCRAQYQSEVVQPLGRYLKARSLSNALSPLQLCADGIIADFDNGLVHIELLDMQESLPADLAVCAAVVALCVLVQSEQSAPLAALSHWPKARLAEILEQTLVEGNQAVLADVEFIAAFGYPEKGACRAGELWQFLLEERIADSSLTSEAMPALTLIKEQGSLAERMLARLPRQWDDEDLFNLYKEVARCLCKDELLS